MSPTMINVQCVRARGLTYFAFAILTFHALPLSTRAQDAAPAPAASAAMPDVVRLKNGGIVRGTIAELAPGDKVVIITPAGETRTYPMNEVEYAGAASGDAAPSAPPVAAPSAPAPAKAAAPGTDPARPFITVHSGEARLRLVGAEDGLTFHVRTGTATATGWGGGGAYTVRADAYSEICTAPCDASLPNGTHAFALSHEGGAPVPVDPIRVDGPTTLYGTYTDRSGIRVGGWLVFIGGAVAGTALMLTAIDGEAGLGTGFYAGTAIFGVTTIVGLVMAMTGDGAEIERQAAP